MNEPNNPIQLALDDLAASVGWDVFANNCTIALIDENDRMKVIDRKTLNAAIARARAQAETIKRLTTELDNLKSSIPVIDATIIAPLRAELAALRRELAAAQSADTATKRG